MTGSEVKHGARTSKPHWDLHACLKAKDNVSQFSVCLSQIFSSRVTGNACTCNSGFSIASMSWLHLRRWLRVKNSDQSYSRHKGELGGTVIQTRLIWQAQERPGREMSWSQDQWDCQHKSLRQGEVSCQHIPGSAAQDGGCWGNAASKTPLHFRLCIMHSN